MDHRLDIFFDLLVTDKYTENKLNIFKTKCGRSPILNCEFILVHLNFWKSEEKKKEQKFVTNPTQKVSDL